MARGGDFPVGYGKPPKHSRFKKGQSGNPSGKKNGARSLKADFEDEMKEEVRISEGGKPRTITKQQLLVKSLLAKAVKGDGRALAKAIDLALQLRCGENAGIDPDLLDADDQVMLAAYDARRRQEQADE